MPCEVPSMFHPRLCRVSAPRHENETWPTWIFTLVPSCDTKIINWKDKQPIKLHLPWLHLHNIDLEKKIPVKFPTPIVLRASKVDQPFEPKISNRQPSHQWSIQKIQPQCQYSISAKHTPYFFTSKSCQIRFPMSCSTKRLRFSFPKWMMLMTCFSMVFCRERPIVYLNLTWERSFKSQPFDGSTTCNDIWTWWSLEAPPSKSGLVL